MFLRQKHVVNMLMKLAPDFSCLADELAEQRPDMNMKVTAFTLSEKSIDTSLNVYLYWNIMKEESGMVLQDYM